MNKKNLSQIVSSEKNVFRVKRWKSTEVVDKDFIKTLRLKLDFTQVVFASILDVSVKTIEKWEQGSVEPRGIVKNFLYILDLHPKLINDIYKIEWNPKKTESATEYILGNFVKTMIKSQDLMESNYQFDTDFEFKAGDFEQTSFVVKNKNCCPAT